MDYGQYQSLSHFGNQSLYPFQSQQVHQSLDQHQAQSIQTQPQEQAQIQQLPELGQEQLRQLERQHQQHYFTTIQHPQVQTSSQGLVPPPPSPWESPSDALGLRTLEFGFATAELAETMNDPANLVVDAYRHAQQDGLLPPIATLEMAEAQARREAPALTPSSAASVATPGSTATASPTAIRTDMTLQDPQVSAQSQPQTQVQNEQQDEQQQAQYQLPQVIQLVERPLKKSRQQARAHHQTPRARAEARKQNQHERQDESPTQIDTQGQTGSTSNQSASKSPVEQQQGQSLTARSNPPSLVTSVPSAGQWYGIHALPASQQRIGSATVVNSNVNGKVPVQLLKQTARESAHPYPPRLRQRRTVSGPAVLSGFTAEMQSNPSVPSQSNARSPSTSLSAPSPASTSPSTSTSVPASQIPAPTSSRPSFPRYLVRTDVHYDLHSNTLTAMLEIPGVPRAAVRVALGDDTKTGQRKLVVRGRMRRVAFPTTFIAGGKGKSSDKTHTEGGNETKDEETGYVLKERKVGEFKRVLVVPPETKDEDILVSMADGILFLRFPAGVQTAAFSQTAASTMATAPNSTHIPNAAEITAQPMQSTQVQPASRLSTSIPTRHASSKQGIDMGGMQYNFRVQTPAASVASTSSSSERVNRSI